MKNKKVNEPALRVVEGEEALDGAALSVVEPHAISVHDDQDLRFPEEFLNSSNKFEFWKTPTEAAAWLEAEINKIPERFPGLDQNNYSAVQMYRSHLQRLENGASKAMEHPDAMRIDRASLQSLNENRQDIGDKIEKATEIMKNLNPHAKFSSDFAGRFTDPVSKEYIKYLEKRIEDKKDNKEKEYPSAETLQKRKEVSVSQNAAMGYKTHEIDNSKKDASISKSGSTRIPGLWVDAFTDFICDAIINAKVSAGKNIEDVYKFLCAEYKLNDREQVTVQHVLKRYGYPIYKDLSGWDWIRNYYAGNEGLKNIRTGEADKDKIKKGE